MAINEHMLATYERLKREVDADGMPHSAVAGLKLMTLEPAFTPDGEERRYKMTLGPLRPQ